MSIVLEQNDYGKSRVRLLRVIRQEGRHDVRELTLSILFEGDFDSAHTAGDNSKILPTDTMKNTVYALAKQYPAETPEDFSLHLVDHFLTYNPQVRQVRIACSEKPWARLALGGKPHPWTFVSGSCERRIASVTATREKTIVEAGVDDLVVLRTSGSGFEGFLRDPFTTLRETRDRILSTSMNVKWRYADGQISFGPVWHGARQALLEVFAEHASRSLQHTLYAMGEALLKSFDEILEVRLSLPNKHFLLADLSAFGFENENEVFIPTDEPHGLIEATLKKK
ncbi:MAG: factor-independent urate hydroxylase [Candidatus Acidiferrales bacterium]